MKKTYIVTDLGPGDGGKGGVVHKISHQLHAHTIVKVGGAQGSHGVVTSSGDRFAFSQFGCGTFEGVRTYLSPRFVASPEGILNEATALQYGCGIRDVFGLLTVDEDVICATPFHGIASRLKELARGTNPRGTIGTGVGEAFRMSETLPELTIHARDLSRSGLRDRLADIRAQVRKNLSRVNSCDFLPLDRGLALSEVNLLSDDAFLEYVANRFEEAGRYVNVVHRDYLSQAVFARDGVVVVESSHGILTDRFQGFHPHTSALRTLPSFTHKMITEAGYTGSIVNLGVTRAYQIRHGAGPMPTSDEAMVDSLVPHSHKEENRYQGKVRVGPLDFVLLRHAIASSGGPQAFQGIALTWFDQVQANGAWHVCDRYRHADDSSFFDSQSEIRTRIGEDAVQLAYQAELGTCLKHVVPERTSYPISLHADREELFDLCAGVVEDQLDVDVRMVSFGPSENEKMCK